MEKTLHLTPEAVCRGRTKLRKRRAAAAAAAAAAQGQVAQTSATPTFQVSKKPMAVSAPTSPLETSGVKARKELQKLECQNPLLTPLRRFQTKQDLNDLETSPSHQTLFLNPNSLRVGLASLDSLALQIPKTPSNSPASSLPPPLSDMTTVTTDLITMVENVSDGSVNEEVFQAGGGVNNTSGGRGSGVEEVMGNEVMSLSRMLCITIILSHWLISVIAQALSVIPPSGAILHLGVLILVALICKSLKK
jgi:hypothetical protein